MPGIITFLSIFTSSARNLDPMKVPVATWVINLKEVGKKALSVKILKIARTIADLDESKDIHKEHIIEAIKYKTNIYKYIEGE